MKMKGMVSAVLAGMLMLCFSVSFADAPDIPISSGVVDAEMAFMSDVGLGDPFAMTSTDPVTTEIQPSTSASFAFDDAPDLATIDTASYADMPTGQGVTPWRSGKRPADNPTTFATERQYRNPG